MAVVSLAYANNLYGWLEAAQRIGKDNLAIDNNKVEHIVIDEVKEENIIANTEKIVETEEKNIEKII